MPVQKRQVYDRVYKSVPTYRVVLPHPLPSATLLQHLILLRHTSTFSINMASAIRFKASSGLLGLSRAAPRALPAQRIAVLTHSAQLVQRGAINSQRRLFSCSGILNGEVIVKVPQMAESISEGTLSALPKKVGEQIEADEEIASIETDKIDVAVNAPEDAVIAEYFVVEGDTVVVGQDLARILTGEDAKSGASDNNKTKSEEPKKEEPKKEESRKEESKPAEAPKPKENTQGKPSATESSKPSPAPKESKPESSASTSGPSRGERTVSLFPHVSIPSPKSNRISFPQEKLSRMRKTIASRLKQSQNTCASLTTIQEIDMTNLMAWRAKYRDEVMEEYGVRLGYMGAFTKATTLAAQKVPQVNAAIDTEKGIITYRDYVDISIAVSGPKGLVTPVLRDGQSLSIVDLEREVATLAKKVNAHKTLCLLFAVLTPITTGSRRQAHHGRSRGRQLQHQQPRHLRFHVWNSPDQLPPSRCLQHERYPAACHGYQWPSRDPTCK